MARVIIVSNRLPLKVSKVDGKLEFHRTEGGVATGLASYANRPDSRWIGWPGIASDDLNDEEKEQISRELRRHNCAPVFLSRKQIDDFYNGYSNSLIWPLFHNLPVRSHDQHDRWWRAYRAVNRAFAEAVTSYAPSSGSRIWVQDYHFMLLPEYLRRLSPEANVGFFLHIPFPEAAIFGKLPEAKRLLIGILGADLVGFHTNAYVQNFLASCAELNIGTPQAGQLVVGDRAVRVTDFPMGIDYQKYAEAGKDRAVRAAMRKYRKRYKGRRVIVAIDRLDPSKGLVERLQAYREFLQTNPKLHRKVVLSMVAAPSRTDIAAYRNLKVRLDKLVAEINATYGSPRWQPIDYMNVALPFEEVSALLQIADVAFIAPLRDGMNLVAKEYVASRRQNGVLILSETAGAAQELTDALLVNPARPATVVAALEKSMQMPRRELKVRFKNMQQQLAANTVHQWAGNFMKTLQQPKPAARALGVTRTLSDARRFELASAYRAARKRLILLDYDGTLVPLSDNYAAAEPPKAVLQLLKRLSQDEANEVVLISGRSENDMQAWFGDLRINLVAEHGAVIKSAGHKSWRETIETGRRWKKAVRPILHKYTNLTPGAEIEEKQFSLVWHYRQASPYYAQKYSVILQRVLRPVVKPLGLSVFNGNKILEIKDPRINKGQAIRRWLRHSHDFIIAIGDDFTDEDTFLALPPEAYSLKVGRGRTKADLRLPNVDSVQELLKQLQK